MKKVVLIAILLSIFTLAEAKDLTVKNVYEAILDEGIQEPKYVLAQATHETGWYKSYNCRVRNNIFGFRSSKWATKGNSEGYKIFNTWEESISYYKNWQIRKGYREGENYLVFLKRIGYAEDPEYERLIKNMLKTLEKKHGI